MTANTWYRIELTISVSSSAATIDAAYYPADATTPVDPAYSTVTGNTGTANITQVSIGSAASATWTGTSYFDDLAADPARPASSGPVDHRPPGLTALPRRNPAEFPEKDQGFFKTRPRPGMPCYVHLVLRVGLWSAEAGWDRPGRQRVRGHHVSVGDSCSGKGHSLGGNVMRKVFSSVLVGMTSIALLSTTVCGFRSDDDTGSTCTAIDAPKSMNDMPASADCPTPGAAARQRRAAGHPGRGDLADQLDPAAFDRTNGDLLAITKISGTNDIAIAGNFTLVYTPDAVSHAGRQLRHRRRDQRCDPVRRAARPTA